MPIRSLPEKPEKIQGVTPEEPTISKAERRKDTAQVMVESGATHVGRIATIVSGAVRDVARELGDFATDVFEMREASRRAEADVDAPPPPSAQNPPPDRAN